MALHSGFTSLDANTDTFSDWLNKTNEISALIIGDNTGAQTSIMTANSSKSWTYGDAVLSSGTTANGEFFANIVSIVDGSNTTSGGLQGAKYTSSNNTLEKDWLYVSTNTAFSSTANIVYVNLTDTLHATNNTHINQHLTVSNTGGYAFFHGNTHVEERFEVGSQTTGAVRSTTVDSLIVTGANVEWYDYSSNTTSSIRTNDNGDLIVDADVTGVGTANTTITLRVDNSDRATLSAANIDFYNAAGNTVGMRWTGSILELGEAQGFQIYNDTTDSFIKETSSGNLFVQANNLVLESTDGTNYIQATAGANVEISYAGNVQVSTTDYGIVLDGEANTNTLRVRSNGQFDSTINVDGLATFNGLTALNGDIDLGNAAGDNITINGQIDSNVIPDANVSYNLGSTSLSWNNVYSNNVVTDYLTVNTDAEFPSGVTFDGVTSFVDINVSGTANILSLEVSELVANGAALVGTEDTVTTTSASIIDSYPKAQSKGLKYIVQGQRSDLSTAIYGVEIMLVHNDTDVFFTRYGEIDNQMSDVVITPVANATHINLQAVCDSASVANTHTFNIVRIETR